MSTLRAPRVVAGAVLEDAVVEVDGGRVVDVRSGGPSDVELAHGVLAPGFVDLQVNGCCGVDVVDATAQEWDVLTVRLLKTGVTVQHDRSPAPPVPTAARTPGGLMDAQEIVAGLGGADDILEIEPCTTRLRAEVRDPSLVDEAALERAGALGVVRRGEALQVVVGPQADTLASEIEDLLG